MSDILAQLKAAHDAADEKRVKVTVPEYGFDLYFPPFTLARRDAARRGINPKDESALYVNTIVTMAQDEDGNQVFPNTPEVKAELHRMSLETLQWIIQRSGGSQINEADLAEVQALDLDDLSPVISGALREAGAERVASAVDRAGGEGLRTALRDLVEAFPDPDSTKNA